MNLQYFHGISFYTFRLAHVLLEYILEKSMVSLTDNVPEISDTYILSKISNLIALKLFFV